MIKEVEIWLKQGLYDFESAKINFNNERYSTAAFLLQQAVEKCLKSFFLCERKGIIPQSHSLIYLASNTSLPKKFMPFLRILTPKFIDTRYPDASIGAPFEIYGKEDVQDLMNKSSEIIKWIEKNIR